jgi:predicted transcriptional regulator
MCPPIDLDDTLTARLQSLSYLRQRPADALLREAVTQYVAREKARESFKAEAEASWAEFKKDGLHLSSEEVADWLAGWGTETEISAPACHE